MIHTFGKIISRSFFFCFRDGAYSSGALLLFSELRNQQYIHESSSMAGPKQALELNQLEVFLRQPDAIMEPNILDVLRRYVSDGGNPLTVVEMLSDNYVGYAHMASLVSSWLKMTDDALKETSTSGPDTADDEAFFLRQLAKKKFDPDKFSGVFAAGPPSWLDGLAADPAGRQLIYHLSAQHRNCLLLNFAIQKILYAGHEGEVASVGSSLAGYFGVFHRLMAGRLGEVPRAAPLRLARIATELQESCSSAEHTYAHAQHILTHLGRHPEGARYRRLSQDLEAHTAKTRGAVVWRMQPWFAPPIQPGDAEAAALVAEVLVADSSSNGSAGGSAPVAEVERLQRLYSEVREAPSLALLRQPRLLHIIIAHLFRPSPSLSPDMQDAFISLLALATSGVDERGEGGRLELGEVAATEGAVRGAMELVRQAGQGMKLGAAEQASAEEALQRPVAAAGALHACAAQLTRADYWRDTYRLSAAPAFLLLLSTIVPRQPLMHAQVVDIVHRALRAMGNSNPEVARALLDIAVMVAAAGAVAPVLAFLEPWAKAADPSLVRYCLFQILNVAAPPYSPFFAAAMIRVMVGSGVRRSRTGHRDSTRLEHLQEFAAACSKLDFDPPLTAREASFLQELQTERY